MPIQKHLLQRLLHLQLITENAVALTAQQTFPEVTIVPPVPPVPPISGCPEDTQWDIRVEQALGTLPVGTVLCLPNGLGNQLATIAGTTTTVDVTVAQPNVGTSDCSPPFVDATATSGSPPPPVSIEDLVCVKLGA